MSGVLCFQTPVPGMARSIYGDRKRFLETYYNPFPGMFTSCCLLVSLVPRALSFVLSDKFDMFC